MSPDDIPGEESLAEAYELVVQSHEGKSIRFGELVAGRGDTLTTIVIFSKINSCPISSYYVFH